MQILENAHPLRFAASLFAQSTGDIGRHRAESLPRAWLGGVAQKVLGLAACPVLVHVPDPSDGAPA